MSFAISTSSVVCTDTISLSAGEKQLIVLARALLQKKKVLILDEATASVDSKTDLVITKLVHEEFKGSTILIIAHRLRVSIEVPRLAR